MESFGAIDARYGPGSHCESVRGPTSFRSSWSVASLRDPHATTTQFVVQVALVFLAYFIAGKLGQATTNIRSSNLGPVWPAYGIALAAGLKYGYQIWPALAAGAFLVALQGSVSAAAAAGQALGATLGALTG